MLLTNNRKALKAAAKSIYFKNYATLSFATLLYIALNLGFTILCGVYGGIFLNIASKKTTFLVTLTFEILAIIFSFPLLFGYISFCVRLPNDEKHQLSDLFEYYSTRKKFISAAAGFISLFRGIVFKILLPVTLFIVLYNNIEQFCNGSVGYFTDYVLCSIKCICFFLFILLFIYCYYSFGKNIAKVIQLNFYNNASKKISFDAKKFFFLRLSLIPLYIISFLTFGILFIVFTIPYTVILYALFFISQQSTDNIVMFSDFDCNLSQNSQSSLKTEVFKINSDIEIQDELE